MSTQLADQPVAQPGVAEERGPGRGRRADLAHSRDPLTSLLTRSAFSAQLETELARARRRNGAVAVVALDLDFFKQVNDLYGHGLGDRVLQGVADRLSAGLRPGDLCGRVGGDEFLLAFVDSGTELATRILTRVGHSVDALEFGPGHGSLSFSAGIAEFPRTSTDVDELMEHADRALYAAKAEGRNRIRVSSSRVGVASVPQIGSAERHRHNVQNTVEALARAVDARNGYTHSHSHAVARYAVALAQTCGMSTARVESIRRAGVLHDVGKIGVPDAILWKTGALDPDEVEVMRRHSRVGYDILMGAGFPEIAEWVAALHERFDGQGYPNGLAGNEIPLASRMLKVVDAFDAMTSPRVYRTPLSAEQALAELGAGAGGEFDPELVYRWVVLVRAGEVEPQRRGMADDTDWAHAAR